MKHLQADELVINTRVYVYFNLHKGCWSLKALDGDNKGRVVFHASSVMLENCAFKVSEAGRQRVIKEQKKNVHAGITGIVKALTAQQNAGTVAGISGLSLDYAKKRVHYNPYLYKTFVMEHTLTPVFTANKVGLYADRSVMILTPKTTTKTPSKTALTARERISATAVPVDVPVDGTPKVKGNFHLTRNSSNAKTGNMAVSTSNADTCPDTCPLKKNGCYADNFHLANHWSKVSIGERGVAWPEFLTQLKSLPARSAFRHDQAGDLVGSHNKIDQPALAQLTRATKRLTGFTYTHYPVLTGAVESTLENNRTAIQSANKGGFTVNISADNIKQVDALMILDVAPVAVLMPKDSAKVTRTKLGNKIVICPAQTSKKTTCSSCLLCADSERSYAIGFLPHGSGAKKAQQVAL